MCDNFRSVITSAVGGWLLNLNRGESDDIAFCIQLGLILPKLQATIKEDLLSISQELMTVIQAGSLDNQTVDINEIKNILMKDLEIFVDRDIMPPLDAILNPPVEDTVVAASEGDVEDASDEESVAS
ncbi:hypothetical protein [Shewanella surugensis]|uniref:DUF3802 family protein n=1 Tax=Shewanella surugensis TaxID=212020 RepID=A0ABT0L7M4_9GAMM|nr:hypothetical protein [Shewanella surugensis]MCL1123692.1 hypothetical protein [Shewanella surugensis]